MNLIKRLLGSKPKQEPVVEVDEYEIDLLVEDEYLRGLLDDEDDTNNFYMEMEEMD